MLPPDTKSIKAYFLQLQALICQTLETADGKATFIHDHWERQEGGSGRTHVMENGKAIEKAGVNFSHIFGQQLPKAATSQRSVLADAPFTALGISVIIHPRNPYIPTAHFNLRFFQSTKIGQEEPIWWFGGGLDLTPYYGFTEDCVHWHQTAQKACEPFGQDLYPRYKKWADDYFYLKHRQEHRGIGGLFFDDVQLENFEHTFAFIRSVGDHFLLAYMPLFERRKNHAYSEKERAFQCYRRGRYVEFNLIYDRGTLFGLQWGGRAESILVSLPPEVSWRYNWRPPEGTEETRLYEEFLVPRDWINL